MSNERISRLEIEEIYNKPFFELIYEAHTEHLKYHEKNTVQWSTLLSVKTGACPEDCGYCSQSAHFNTDLPKETLIDVEEVLANAKLAKEGGSTRFCMGAAWRKVADRDMPKVKKMISTVKEMGLETCVTLGSVTEDQAKEFKEAGLDYYNHNLDTSREHYKNVISTRTYDERLDTIDNVRKAGINVCCGGILGLGEEEKDRIGLLHELANMEEYPESVPVNKLVAIKGTPLGDQGVEEVDKFDFIRMIATARILMPKTYVRLSAGRESMTEEMQALCFFAGANSIFTGDKLLTTENRSYNEDKALFAKLNLSIETAKTECLEKVD